MTNIPKISTDTIARTATAAVVLLNSLLVMAGKAPLDLDESSLYEAGSVVATVLTTAWVWWKDNDIRTATRLAKVQAQALRELERVETTQDPSSEEEAQLS